MAKFRFGLETLLRHREDVEQQERDELMRRNYKYQVELHNLEELQLQLQSTVAELAVKQTENPELHELDGYHRYLSRLNLEAAACEKRLAQLQSEVEAQTSVVVEASKKRKTLASMRTKKEKEFIIEQEKQYQKEIDDLVVTRYARKDPESLR